MTQQLFLCSEKYSIQATRKRPWTKTFMRTILKISLDSMVYRAWWS
jgi:hypothetical protein